MPGAGFLNLEKGYNNDLLNIKGRMMWSGLFTWNSCEELDSVSVTVERELSVSHRAVWHKGPSCHFATTLIAIDTDDTSWWMT